MVPAHIKIQISLIIREIIREMPNLTNNQLIFKYEILFLFFMLIKITKPLIIISGEECLGAKWGNRNKYDIFLEGNITMCIKKFKCIPLNSGNPFFGIWP